ncbi:MAG: undecaprenyl-diphosphate phosphatase, partial [Actinomycetes bacterium]
MSWLEAAVLGLVQGLTEFLPISSTAHIRVVSELAGWEDPGAAFTAVTQLGTESAVLIYFRHDIANIIRSWTLSLFRPELRGEPEARMGWYVIVGTIPIGVLGFLLRDAIEGPARNLWLIASMLVVFGLALG